VHEADLLKQFRHLSHAIEQARVCLCARRPLFVWLLRTCSEIVLFIMATLGILEFILFDPKQKAVTKFQEFFKIQPAKIELHNLVQIANVILQLHTQILHCNDVPVLDFTLTRRTSWRSHRISKIVNFLQRKTQQDATAYQIFIIPYLK
jgi:hypothetical protein